MNITPSIQLGLDLATSASIISAAIAIVLSSRRDRKRRHQETRVIELTKALNYLIDQTRILRTTQKELLTQFHNPDTADLSTEQFISSPMAVAEECTVLLQTSFAVWGTESERDVLKNLRAKCNNWIQRVFEDLKARRQLNSKLSEVDDYLEEAYQSLASELRR